MKSNRNFKVLGILLLGLVGIGLSAGSASAQQAYRGRFTLPFEAKWGESTLPAGDYTFTLDHATAEGNLNILSQDKKTAAIVHVSGVTELSKATTSSLTAVRSGGTYRIRVLTAAEIGKAFNCGAPKGESQMMAQAPWLIQRIPVLVASK
jgi:hypothetical protein